MTIRGWLKIIALLLILILFVLTNPSEDEFISWYMFNHPEGGDFFLRYNRNSFIRG